MCDKKLTQTSAFAYLDEIRSLFINTFSQKEIDTAISYTLNDKFKESIKTKQTYYNNNLNESDKVAQLEKGVKAYKDSVIDANEVLNLRGEKINLIVKKADNLRNESKTYYTSAKKVKWHVKCQRIKLILFIVLICLVIGYFISVAVCGGFTYASCRS
jgi:vesicle-associated membrane protein 7